MFQEHLDYFISKHLKDKTDNIRFPTASCDLDFSDQALKTKTQSLAAN